MRKTSGAGYQNAEKIIIENEEKTFEILVKGKDGDDGFYESPLVINGVFYEYRSSVKMPFDITLYPFGTELDEYTIFSDIYYDKEEWNLLIKVNSKSEKKNRKIMEGEE